MSSSASSSSTNEPKLPSNFMDINPFVLSIYFRNYETIKNIKDYENVTIGRDSSTGYISVYVDGNLIVVPNAQNTGAVGFSELSKRLDSFLDGNTKKKYFEKYITTKSLQIPYSTLSDGSILKDFLPLVVQNLESEETSIPGSPEITPAGTSTLGGSLDLNTGETDGTDSIDEEEKSRDPPNLEAQQKVKDEANDQLRYIERENVLDMPVPNEPIPEGQEDPTMKSEQILDQYNFEKLLSGPVYVPVFPLSYNIYKPKIEKIIENLSKEDMLNHSNRIVENYGIELFIDKLVYKYNSDIRLIEKQFNEIVSLFKTYLNPQKSEEKGLSVEDIIEIRDTLAQDNIFVRPRDIIQRVNPDVFNAQKETDLKKIIVKKDISSKKERESLLRVAGTNIIADDMNNFEENLDPSSRNHTTRFIENYDYNYIDPIEIKMLREDTQPFLYQKYKIGVGSTLNDTVNVEALVSMQNAVITGAYGNDKKIDEELNNGQEYHDTNSMSVNLEVMDCCEDCS